MTRVEGTVIVPAPLADVFRYASDWRFWEEWFEGVSHFKPITGVVRGNGARYRYEARLLGMTATVETEICDFVEDRGWRGVARQGTTYWTFEAVGEQTRFSYALEYGLPVPIVGPLLDTWLLKGQWRRLIDTSLGNLRRRFEERRES